jgi:hypothetical protein
MQVITLCIPMKEGNCCFDLTLVTIVFRMTDLVFVEKDSCHATHCPWYFLCVVFLAATRFQCTTFPGTIAVPFEMTTALLGQR